MDKIEAYLMTQRLLDKNGKQHTWMFDCPMYKNQKAARIANEYYNKPSGFVQPTGEPCFMLQGVPICSVDNQNPKENQQKYKKLFGC
jgi:hypothetical protein